MEINGTLSAIVTGGASGLGEATARMLSSMGAKVAIFDLDIDKGSNIAKELNSDFYEVDVSDVNSVNQAVLDFSKQNEGIQVAVNCAGIGPAAKTVSRGEAHSSELFAKVININLTSTFLMSKFAIKKMLKNKSGKIVNITSVVGHTGNLGQVNYTASKAGIVAMSKSLAIEYAKKNININCISPGFIQTAMTDKIDDKFKEVIISKIPSARLGEPEDIANAVLFLTSSQSDYINGETLHVNGGMYMA